MLIINPKVGHHPHRLSINLEQAQVLEINLRVISNKMVEIKIRVDPSHLLDIRK
jgi:hypothetical protein